LQDENTLYGQNERQHSRKLVLTSDDKTTIQALKEVADKFSTKRDWAKFHNPKDLSIGIVTEGSELLAIFRFKTDKEVKQILGNQLMANQIKHELADVLFFILRFSQMTGTDLTEAFLEKMKLNEIRYPVDKSKGSNKKYTEL
jgi:NTP pyrophosphatase (non-canonical NTP hydrolase)